MTQHLMKPVNARPMLERFAAPNTRAQTQREKSTEPEVGIFFVYDGCVLIDGTPLSESQEYGEVMGHGTGHDSFWCTLQRNHLVPSRGRDTDFSVPPAQIRTGGFPASGSYLR
jgi:hypothetical protein